MATEPQRYHVKLYQLLKTPAGQTMPVAARIECYAEGEQPRIFWSTMPVVETLRDLIQWDMFQILREINENLSDMLDELERDGWTIDSETEHDQQQGKAAIYRITHFTLLRDGDDER